MATELRTDQSEWNALNKIISLAYAHILLISKEGFEKQQASAALRVARRILIDAIIEEDGYGQDEADEDRFEYERTKDAQ